MNNDIEGFIGTWKKRLRDRAELIQTTGCRQTSRRR